MATVLVFAQDGDGEIRPLYITTQEDFESGNKREVKTRGRKVFAVPVLIEASFDKDAKYTKVDRAVVGR